MSNDDKPEDNEEDIISSAKLLVNSYRDKYKSINPEVLFKLSELKEIVSQQKQESPDEVALKIEHVLGDLETSETLRQERWHISLHCPYCNSQDVKRLALDKQENKTNYKYLCLTCNETFNDDSATDIAQGVPPIHSWMFCWYLLGCTSSLQYIATKLGLRIATVEMMIQHMQKLFKSDAPLKNFMSFDEWVLKHGKNYKIIIQQAIKKQTEMFRGFSLEQPSDTAEMRKSKERAKPQNKNK